MPPVSRQAKPNIEEIDKTASLSNNGTEAINGNQSQFENFRPDIYRFIVSSIESIAEGQIKTLKDRVSEYKKECKRLQEKYEEEIKKNSQLEGQFKTLEKYGIGIVSFVLIQAITLITVFFGYINPILNHIKPHNETLKNKVEQIKQTPQPQKVQQNKQ